MKITTNHAPVRPPIESFTCALTLDEAVVLAAILGRISGEGEVKQVAVELYRVLDATINRELGGKEYRRRSATPHAITGRGSGAIQTVTGVTISDLYPQRKPS
jgi:hypothetical protein